MAENNPFIANEQVYLGREGTGAAQVFGMPANPLDTYLKIQGNKAAQAQKAAELEAAQKKARDTEWDKMQDVGNPKYWEEMTYEIQDSRNKVKDFFIEAQSRGLSPSDPRVRKTANQLSKELQQKADMSLAYKATMDQAMEKLKGNDHYTPQATSYVRDAWFTPEGKFKGFDNADRNDVINRLNDPAYFNRSAIGRDFVKNLPMNVQQTYKTLYDSLGKTFDITQVASQLYEMDAQGNPQINPLTNTPYLKMSEYVRTAAKADPEIARILQAETSDITDPEKLKAAEDKVLRDMLAPWAKTTVQDRPGATTKYPSTPKGKSPWDGLEIQTSEDVDLADYEQVSNDGTAGYQGIFVPTPGIIKGAYLGEVDGQNTNVNVDAFGVDSTGAPYVMVTYDNPGAGTGVSEARLPFDDKTKKAIRNSFKKDEDRKGYDNFVGRFEKAIKDRSAVKLDETRLEGVIDQMIALPNEQLKEELAKNGIPVEASKDRHSEFGKLFKGAPAYDYIEIDGKRYYPSDPASKKELKAYLYNNYKEQFIRSGQGEPAQETGFKAADAPVTTDELDIINSIEW